MVRYRNWNATIATADLLKPLFKKWHKILSSATSRLARCRYPDHPYWYDERTQVGWLALAAQSNRWLPLQEPSVPRRTKGMGRSDLWIYSSRAGKTKVLDFEAKKADLPVHTLHRYESFSEVDDIGGKLTRAVRQVRDKKSGYEGDVAVGIVFVRLHARKNTRRAELQRLAQMASKHVTSKNVLKDAGADFVGLYLAPYKFIKRVLAHKSNKKEAPYLGVAVVGRIAR